MSVTRDIYVDQGMDFSGTFQYSVANNLVDLSTSTVTGSLRKSPESSPIAFLITKIDAKNGIISFALSSSQTGALSYQNTYTYDIIETTATGIKRRMLEGNVIVSEGVTK